jgi:prepilin-type processing-associated H-X9-DG protein
MGEGSKGAMRQNMYTRVTEIIDGTSMTTLYSELINSGLCWCDSDNRITVTGVDAGNTCVLNCQTPSTGGGDISSGHGTSGANIAFADGSARLVAPGIDINVLVSLVTKGGGEVIPPW